MEAAAGAAALEEGGVVALAELADVHGAALDREAGRGLTRRKERPGPRPNRKRPGARIPAAAVRVYLAWR
jgi:hypothetical protein